MEGFLTGELRRGQATKLITSLSKWINNSSGMALNSHGLLIALFKRLAVLLRNICIWAFSSLESYWGIYFSSFHHVHPYPSMLEQAISTLSFLWKTLWRTREGLKKKTTKNQRNKHKKTNTKQTTTKTPKQPNPKQTHKRLWWAQGPSPQLSRGVRTSDTQNSITKKKRRGRCNCHLPAGPSGIDYFFPLGPCLWVELCFH